MESRQVRIESKRLVGAALSLGCAMASLGACSEAGPTAGTVPEIKTDGGAGADAGSGSEAGVDSSPEGKDSTTPAATSFVLVHGAWMGAWAWDGVATRLRKEGASVSVVELPGHGEDRTAPKAVSLESYVAAVTTAIDAAKGKVVLVGHSMAGVVVTEAAEKRPERIQTLVYLGAYLPKDGETLQSLAGKDAASKVGPLLRIDSDAGIAGLPKESLIDVFCADCALPERTLLTTKYRDEPLYPFATPARPTAERWGKVPKVYVFTKRDQAVSPTLQQAMTEGVTFVKTVTLDTSHSPFLSEPELVKATLMGL